MRKYFLMGSLLAVAAWFAPSAMAQSATPEGRDFSGVWRLSKAAGPPWKPDANKQFATDMQLLPWAQAHCKEVGCARAVNSGGIAGGDAYFQGKDPALIRCAPYGFPRIMLEGGYLELVETRKQDRIFIRFFLNNDEREIWIDGRGHPENSQRPWMGHSIGHWDGDTLVVDTIGLTAGENGKYKWLDGAGFPHTDQLHVVERIHRVNRTTLQVDMVIEDPGTFRTPIRSTIQYRLIEDPAILEDSSPSIEYTRCEDHVYADSQTEVWPHVTSDYDYTPQFPRAGTAIYEGGE